MRKTAPLALIGSLAFFPAPSHAGDIEADARQQVRALLQDWVRAENDHDAAALDRILDEKFITTSGAGQPHNKAAFITSLTRGKADPAQSQTLTDESVVVDGDTAVAVGTDIFHRGDGAKPDGLALRYTITVIRRGGHWRALAEHVVAMTP